MYLVGCNGATNLAGADMQPLYLGALHPLHPQALDLELLGRHPIVAETVVVTGYQDAGMQSVAQDRGGKLLARQRGKCTVEGQDYQHLYPIMGQPSSLLVGRGEELKIGLGSQDQPRMRLKGDHNALQGLLLGNHPQTGQQSLMAAVYAVKRADRNDRGTLQEWLIQIVYDMQRVSHSSPPL